MVFLKYRRNRNLGDKVFSKALRYGTIGRKLYKNYAPAVGTAYAAYRIAKKIKRTVNPEQKFLDKSISDSVIPSTGTTSLVLTNMGQGVTADTRTGISIRASSIYINFKLYRNANATQLYDSVRVLLFIDTNQDENATYPVTADLLTSDTAPNNINSTYNIRKAGRFNVLHDKVYTLTEVRPALNMKVYKRIGHHLRYQGSGTGAADMRQGQIYLMFITDQSVNGPGQTCQTRFRYYDN